jgi:hypothetical protein
MSTHQRPDWAGGVFFTLVLVSFLLLFAAVVTHR